MKGKMPGLMHLVFILMSGLVSCEEIPDINHPADPIPVIFGIFDKYDYVHYLKVGKTFQANVDPMQSIKIYDSLYFDQPEVTVYFKSRFGDSTSLEPYIVEEVPRDSGVFLYPDQLVYRFEKRLRDFMGHIGVRVRYPGLPDVSAEVFLLDSTKINTPKKAQGYLYLVPDSPIRVQWDIPPYPVPYPAGWYEIDFAFEFFEQTIDSLRPAVVHIQNTNFADSETPRYYELNITYDEFIREVLAQLEDDPAVIRRYFGYHYIKTNSGDEHMVKYMRYLNGFTDFNDREFSNITNGIGLIASRTSGMVDSLQFDYQTKQQLINDNRLKKYKFVTHQPPLSTQ